MATERNRTGTTTAKRRSNVTTSVAGQAQLFAHAGKTLQPTQPLTGTALACFNDVVASRETATWTPHDLRIATSLAQMTASLAATMDRMVAENPILFSNRGTPVANPVYNITMQLSSAVQALGRSLGLSAASRTLTNSAQGKRNLADAEARNVIAKAAEHAGLI